MGRYITTTVFFHEHHRVVEKLLKRSRTILAVNESDPDQILGYVTAEKVPGFSVLHYLYVKQAYRNLGIGKKLIEEVLDEPRSDPIIYTHSTDEGEVVARKIKGIFNPYWAR